MKALWHALSVLLLVLVVGCGEGSGAADDLFFPTSEPGEEHALAPLQATLVLSGRCLFAESEVQGTFLLLWPGGWSVRTEGGLVRVLDDTGGEVAVEGEEVTFVGGETSVQLAQRAFGVEIPDACGSVGVWIVGEIAAGNP
jgi:hypothetical protein